MISPYKNKNAKLPRPIHKTILESSEAIDDRKLSGILAKRLKEESPSGFISPSIRWNCLLRIITPMAASIPCTAADGKKSLNAPILSRPNIKTNTPEMLTAAINCKYPSCGVAPKVVTAARLTTTKPFPGPVIVKLEPPNRETISAPTTALTNPAKAGTPLAKARPKHSGSATRDTTKPGKILDSMDLN